MEQDLAQRGLRHVHGDHGVRRLPPRLGTLGQLRAGALRRVRDRFAGLDPHGGVRGAIPADCEGMFDVLTYQKGGALLRMLQQYLGEDRFRDGVRLYLARHSYSNTETGDLWDAIEDATGEPVRRLMDSWIWQAGYRS
ncbi:MAG: M1 family aminopeptidase [Ilumatobacteraceae bacterium]